MAINGLKICNARHRYNAFVRKFYLTGIVWHPEKFCAKRDTFTLLIAIFEY